MQTINSNIMGIFIVCVSFIFLQSCATDWQTKTTFYRSIQSNIVFDKGTIIDGDIYINNQNCGVVPDSIPVQYEQLYHRQVRGATYWETEPALATLVSIISLGVYIPFSFIPCDIQSRQVPQYIYRNNLCNIQIVNEGINVFEKDIVLKGEAAVRVFSE